MYSCRRVVEILAQEEPLSLRGRMELKIHLWMCKHCGRYARQIQLVGQNFRAWVTKQYSAEDLKRLKIKLKEKIRRGML